MAHLDETSGFQCKSETTHAYNSHKANHMGFATFLPVLQDTVGDRSAKNLALTIRSQAHATNSRPRHVFVVLQTSVSESQNRSLDAIRNKGLRPGSLGTPKALTRDSSSGTLTGDVWPNSRRFARAKRPALPQTCESAYCSFPNTDGIEVGMTNFAFNILSKASLNSSSPIPSPKSET